MAKITRVLQKLFGSTASADQIGQFGSLAAGTPVTTTDPATMQSLSNWLEGWFGAVLGGNSPAIEDMNAVCFVFARQLAYIFQNGIPEWETNTTYYIGSVVASGLNTYTSIVDDNLGNLVTDTTKWINNKKSPTVQRFKTPEVSTYTTPANCKRLVVTVIGAGGGGGGAGTGSSGGAGGLGGTTSFGTTLVVCAGGPGGTNNGDSGGGGGAVTIAGPTEIYAIAGSSGGGSNQSALVATYTQGGDGGTNAFGGSGGGAGTNGTGGTAVANTGAGGGGGGGNAVASCASGSGGGGGGFAKVIIDNPSATYAYTVGTGGGAGAAGTNGGAGGAGANGMIVVEEFY